MATISTTTPLLSNGIYTSPSISTSGAGGVAIVGTAFSDQNGQLLIQQSYNQTNWDYVSPITIVANTGIGFQDTVVAPYFRLVYNNGPSAQTAFRLNANLRDGNGNFVSPVPPSTGGQFLVLQATAQGGWLYVGRFDGSSGWDACAQAAIQLNANGKYAAFDVSTGVVANEAITKSTTAMPTPF